MTRRRASVFLSVSAVCALGCGDDGATGDAGDAASRMDGTPAGDTSRPPPDTAVPTGDYDCDSPEASWLLCDGFEAGDGDFTAWFAASDFLTSVGEDDRDRITISDVLPHSGGHALHMPGTNPAFLGGDVGWVSCEGEQRANCDPQNHEQLYMRVFVRFAPDHGYVHHFLSVGGRDQFLGYGSAGCLPNGVSEMGTTVDFREDSHESHFYTYHLDMSCDTNCDRYLDEAARCAGCEERGFPTCDVEGQCCWGNHFEAPTPVAFPVDEWFCFEMMMRPNTPGAADGVMAYWVNDELAHQEEGLRFRTSEALGMNRATVAHYIDNGDADRPHAVWFDDVVISTERIGCASF